MTLSSPTSTDRCFVTPVACTETLLLDTTNPQIIGAVDNILATSQPSSPVARPTDIYKLRDRSSTNDSTGSSSSSSSSSTLDRIEYVEVPTKVKRGSVSYYVVDVFQHRRNSLRRASDAAYTATVASRIAGADLLSFRLMEREADYQLEFRFAAFRDLKNALQIIANQHTEECTHCRLLNAFLSQSNNQAWTVKRLVTSSANRQKLLATFLNGVLSLTSNDDTVGNATNNRTCCVNDEVTELLTRYLRRRYDGSLGII